MHSRGGVPQLVQWHHDKHLAGALAPDRNTLLLRPGQCIPDPVLGSRFCDRVLVLTPRKGKGAPGAEAHKPLCRLFLYSSDSFFILDRW
jgi:hypothetical protein